MIDVNPASFSNVRGDVNLFTFFTRGSVWFKIIPFYIQNCA
jgi:hypothetical protein